MSRSIKRLTNCELPDIPTLWTLPDAQTHTTAIFAHANNREPIALQTKKTFVKRSRSKYPGRSVDMKYSSRAILHRAPRGARPSDRGAAQLRPTGSCRVITAGSPQHLHAYGVDKSDVGRHPCASTWVRMGHWHFAQGGGCLSKPTHPPTPRR